MMVTDKAIGQLIMKYNETDWEFAMRVASQLGNTLHELSFSKPVREIDKYPRSKKMIGQLNPIVQAMEM